MHGQYRNCPLPDILKSRLAKGHIGGREVSLAFLPEVIQPAGAFYSSANDLLKYLAANMGLIHTKINDILQDTHLIRHERYTIANSSKSLLAVYVGLEWLIGTNLGTEIINHSGELDGYISYVEFIPTKQIGTVVLCSCDEKDAPNTKYHQGVELGAIFPFLVPPTPLL